MISYSSTEDETKVVVHANLANGLEVGLVKATMFHPPMDRPSSQLIRLIGDSPVISSLQVHPLYRGNGVSRKIIETLLSKITPPFIIAEPYEAYGEKPRLTAPQLASFYKKFGYTEEVDSIRKVGKEPEAILLYNPDFDAKIKVLASTMRVEVQNNKNVTIDGKPISLAEMKKLSEAAYETQVYGSFNRLIGLYHARRFFTHPLGWTVAYYGNDNVIADSLDAPEDYVKQLATQRYDINRAYAAGYIITNFSTDGTATISWVADYENFLRIAIAVVSYLINYIGVDKIVVQRMRYNGVSYEVAEKIELETHLDLKRMGREF